MIARFGAPTAARLLLLALLSLTLGACATAPASYPEPIGDSMEGLNRNINSFNMTLDRSLLRPAAQGYSKLPGPVVSSVGNFFDNLREIRTFVNDLLQGKPKRAGSTLGRFALNSTVGIGGLFDPATSAGIQQHTESFAETLAVWGIPSGEYFVIPFLGPATVRDAAGRLVDFFTHPFMLYDADNVIVDNLWLLDYVDGRYRLLPADKALQESLDPYVFLREAYIQRMRYSIYDGNPPLVDFEDEDWGDEEDWDLDEPETPETRDPE